MTSSLSLKGQAGQKQLVTGGGNNAQPWSPHTKTQTKHEKKNKTKRRLFCTYAAHAQYEITLSVFITLLTGLHSPWFFVTCAFVHVLHECCCVSLRSFSLWALAASLSATARSLEPTGRQSESCEASPPVVSTQAYLYPPGLQRMAPGVHTEPNPLEVRWGMGTDPHQGRGRWPPARLSSQPDCGGWQRAKGPPQLRGWPCRGPAGHK